MRRVATNRMVLVLSVFILLVCAIWAVLADRLVPTACSYPTPPANAQYLHCPDDSSP